VVREEQFIGRDREGDIGKIAGLAAQKGRSYAVDRKKGGYHQLKGGKIEALKEIEERKKKEKRQGIRQ